jgi:hypothetical protein
MLHTEKGGSRGNAMKSRKRQRLGPTSQYIPILQCHIDNQCKESHSHLLLSSIFHFWFCSLISKEAAAPMKTGGSPPGLYASPPSTPYLLVCVTCEYWLPSNSVLFLLLGLPASALLAYRCQCALLIYYVVTVSDNQVLMSKKRASEPNY